MRVVVVLGRWGLQVGSEVESGEETKSGGRDRERTNAYPLLPLSYLLSSLLRLLGVMTTFPHAKQNPEPQIHSTRCETSCPPHPHLNPYAPIAENEEEDEEDDDERHLRLCLESSLPSLSS